MPGKLVHRYTGVDYEVVVDDLQMKHKDFFHWKNLYVMMREWLVENHWTTRKDTKFPETFHRHKEHQKGQTDVRIAWRFTKIPEENTYYRYDFDIDFNCIGIRDDEVMHDGIKYKANWGEVEIKFWAKIVSDHTGAWRKHWFLKHINHLFWKRIFHADFQMHRRELYREVYRFQEAIKTFLKLKTYLPEPESDEVFFDKEFG